MKRETKKIEQSAHYFQVASKLVSQDTMKYFAGKLLLLTLSSLAVANGEFQVSTGAGLSFEIPNDYMLIVCFFSPPSAGTSLPSGQIDEGSYNHNDEGSYNQVDQVSYNRVNQGPYNQGNQGPYNQGNQGPYLQVNQGTDPEIGQGRGERSAQRYAQWDAQRMAQRNAHCLGLLVLDGWVSQLVQLNSL